MKKDTADAKLETRNSKLPSADSRKMERRTMCEANAYLLKGGNEVLFLESVDVLENTGKEIRVTSIFGEQKTVKGQIRRMSLVDHKIIIEENP